MSHPNAEHVSLATGQWRASSFHNCAVIKAPLNLAPGLSGESSTSTLLGGCQSPSISHGSAPPLAPQAHPCHAAGGGAESGASSVQASQLGWGMGLNGQEKVFFTLTQLPTYCCRGATACKGPTGKCFKKLHSPHTH